jgi:hypothetical protein
VCQTHGPGPDTGPADGYHVHMTVVLDWDGKEVPDELRTLPKGRYVIAPVDAVPALTAEEEQGLEEALDALDRGEGVDLDQVRTELDELVRRR